MSQKKNKSIEAVMLFVLSLTLVEGLIAFYLVITSPPQTTLTTVLFVLLVMVFIAIFIGLMLIIIRTVKSKEYSQNILKKINTLLSNPFRILYFYLILFAVIIFIPVLLFFGKPDNTILTLVIKRTIYPLIWFWLVSIQSVLFLNRLFSFRSVLQDSKVSNSLISWFISDDKPENEIQLTTKITKYLFIFGILLCVFMIVNFFLVSLAKPGFSCDSYLYWALSKTISADFYRNDYIISQYIMDTNYSTDAPPFYPILIWLVNHIYDFKIYGGFVINIVVAFGNLFMLIKLSKLLFKLAIYGILIFYILFSYQPFLQELRAARIIPFAIFLQLVIIYYIMKKDSLKVRDVAVLGFLAGLSTLSRFDFLTAGLMLGIVILSIDHNKWLHKIFAYYGMLLLTFSPWIYYSYTRFGKFMISKDVRTVTSTIVVHSNNYFPAGQEPTTIFEEPILGIFATLSRIRSVALGFYGVVSSPPYSTFFAAALTVIVIAGVVNLLVRIAEGQKAIEIPEDVWKLLKIGMVYLSIWFTTALSGYDLDRYYSPVLLYLTLLVVTVINQLFNPVLDKRRLKGWFFQALVLVPFIFMITTSTWFYDLGITYPEVKQKIEAQSHLGPELDVLKKYDGTPVVMIADGYNWCKFGALSNIKTYGMPFNLTPDNIKQFFSDYSNITHVFIPNTPTYRFISSYIKLDRIDDNVPMYEIVR